MRIEKLEKINLPEIEALKKHYQNGALSTSEFYNKIIIILLEEYVKETGISKISTEVLKEKKQEASKILNSL